VDLSAARKLNAPINAAAAIAAKIFRIPVSPGTAQNSAHRTLPCHQTQNFQIRFAVYGAQRFATTCFTPLPPWPYTACEVIVNVTRTFLSVLGVAALICLSSASNLNSRASQSAQQKPTEKSSEKTQEKPAPKIPAQIELLETRVGFETNGDSRKEVHAVVKINDELGVRQFARLNFDFNRAFEQVEIPLVRVTHQSGGTVDVLPSAITDTPNPAVVNAPAYQDVRVKSVRILGLEPGDSLEYRVITTTTHHPLAPDFWYEHTFDRTGVVSHEILELDLPASRFEKSEATKFLPPTPGNPAGAAFSQDEIVSEQERLRSGKIYISSETQGASQVKSDERGEARLHYSWNVPSESPRHKPPPSEPEASGQPDIAVTTFSSWPQVVGALSQACYIVPATASYTAEEKQTAKLQLEPHRSDDLEALYDYVSQKIRTVDLPLSSAGFHARLPADTLSSGYGTPSDKAALLIALTRGATPSCGFVLDSERWPLSQVPRPSSFDQILVHVTAGSRSLFLDPSLEVAPFGEVRADLRGRDFLIETNPAQLVGHIVQGYSDYYSWEKIPRDLPFASSQRVTIDATLDAAGKLTARPHYVMRGDNELLLRVAFHQSSKEKWDEVAQLLALSDGFRGKISKATASDPYETHVPFSVSYEIAQPKFLDWSKKPLRIPAILPLLGLPDPPAKTAPGASPTPIDLGTPLDVEVNATIHLPPGTTAHIPTGTSVQRDFATYSSSYSAKEATLTATRHLNFILKEIPPDRAADYNAFLRAVQNDESQFFTLERSEPPAPKPQTP
jgi:hypothetical protein